MKTEFYQSRKALLDALSGKSNNKIDVNKSLFLYLFSYVTTDGEQVLCPDAVTFAKRFNEMYGEQVVAKTTRIVTPQSFLVTFLDENKKPIKVTKESVVESSVKVDDQEDKTFDLEYAKSLEYAETKAEAKLALETYGREFGVELSRGKKFSSMLEDLQKELQE